jgi:hypothetical protein
MTINQKLHKLNILKDFMDVLDSREEATKDGIEYEMERLKEEGEEDNAYRKENIKNWNDKLEAINWLRKELDKLA